MEVLHLPSLRVPLKLLDSIEARSHGQVGEQLPVDLFAALGFVSSFGMDCSEDKFRIMLLLSLRRTNQNAAEAQPQHSGRGLAAMISNADRMKATDL